jgi:hypothetical protein
VQYDIEMPHASIPWENIKARHLIPVRIRRGVRKWVRREPRNRRQTAEGMLQLFRKR